jgi:uncharacterized protein with von Willebrand factor type A (vWA) domain
MMMSGLDWLQPGGHLLHNLLLFGRVCKALGMAVTPYRMIEVAQALALIDLASRHDVYHAMRALIVTHQRDIELFDQAFDLFWQRPTDDWTQLDLDSLGEQKQRRQPRVAPPGTRKTDNDNHLPEPESTIISVQTTYSQEERLRHKDFAEMNAEELAAARVIMEQMPRSLGFRQVRRKQPGRGSHLDLRRTLRSNQAYAGEIINLPTLRPKIKPRPIVVICDISGSMERYTRVFLHFMHICAITMTQVESFVFSVHLTRITHQIRHKSVDRALKEVGANVNDWGSGTRTGEALRTFNYGWSRRVLGRGAIVLIITDGWDRGEPDMLAHEMARLQRSTHRLIWLNPLLGVPEYEPLTRGAQAMLPHIDDFLPLRNLANLEMVMKTLQKLNWQRRQERPYRAYMTREAAV